MEHERAVLVAEQVDGGFGGLGDEDAGSGHWGVGVEFVKTETVILSVAKDLITPALRPERILTQVVSA
ncbi:hypothetical protein GCM10022409_08600 [Hymenobacter glaciei]|uniref:Uncharacterized protein n=1 Tax=Hymenobacter glaciei TaxID=877209 RepID=A0ABP7TKI2_9BACT